MDGDHFRKCILHIHIVAYPATTIILMLGRDIRKLYTHGYGSLLSDRVSFGLSISILLSLGISTVLSLYLISKSFKQFSFQALQIYTVIYFVSILLNNYMYSVKNERDGQIKQRSVFYSILNLFHIWQYTMDGTTLMITIERLKICNGFLRRRSLFGVSLLRFVYFDLALVWVTCFQIVASCFYVLSNFKGKKFNLAYRETLVPVLGQIISVTLCGLDGILLWKGIRKKDPKLLRLYLAIKLALFIPFTITWNIIIYRMELIIIGKPSDSYTKMLPILVVVPYIMGIFAIDCFIRSFTEHLHEIANSNPTLIYFNKHNSNHNFGSRRTKDNHLEKITNEFLKTENISRVLVRLEDSESKLGSGHSANVYKGKLCTKIKNIEVGVGTTVAVKLLRDSYNTNFEYDLSTTENYTLAIFSEIRCLNAFSNGHENLVKFYGVARHAGDLGIVIEYCCGGSLEKYLRSIRKSPEFPANVDKQELLKLHRWAAQIASALTFLSNKNIVHGDLATRNILLDEDGNSKVSDFGSSIHLYNYQTYAKSKQSVFPWRWMAPESLSDLKFSVASDIWSYGILLWELYTFGEIPWQGLEWTSDFVSDLRAGTMTLERPQFATLEIYEQLIRNCLRVLENQRMPFTKISAFFLSMMVVVQFTY